MAERLVDLHPEEKISFFSNLVASKTMERLSALSCGVVFKYVLTNSDYRNELYSHYCDLMNDISWDLVGEKSIDRDAATDLTL